MNRRLNEVDKLQKDVLTFAKNEFQILKAGVSREFKEYKRIVDGLAASNMILHFTIKRMFLEIPANSDWPETLEILKTKTDHLHNYLEPSGLNMKTIKELKRLIVEAEKLLD